MREQPPVLLAGLGAASDCQSTMPSPSTKATDGVATNKEASMKAQAIQAGVWNPTTECSSIRSSWLNPHEACMRHSYFIAISIQDKYGLMWTDDIPCCYWQYWQYPHEIWSSILGSWNSHRICLGLRSKTPQVLLVGLDFISADRASGLEGRLAGGFIILLHLQHGAKRVGDGKRTVLNLFNTLWQSNMVMGNGPFIGILLLKHPFSSGMLHCRVWLPESTPPLTDRFPWHQIARSLVESPNTREVMV